jgi:DNA-binding transcriptional LysR family regulator
MGASSGDRARHLLIHAQMVAAGLGVAVLSVWATVLEEGAGMLRPVRDRAFSFSRRFVLARREDRELTGADAAGWRGRTK